MWMNITPNYSESIVLAVSISTLPATKIATYLLPIPGKNNQIGNINNNINISDSDKYRCNYNYKFPNIDIISPESYFGQNTPSTLAAYYKHAEIVSLLINHPNMTKNGINIYETIRQMNQLRM